VSYLYGESDERVQLALALTVRALRAGSACLDLAVAADNVLAGDDDSAADDWPPAQLWPPADEWLAAVAASPLTASGPDAPSSTPLRLVDGLLYLEKYWTEESNVGAELALRRAREPIHTPPTAAQLDELFAGIDPDVAQRQAIAVAASCGVSVIAGGPGTGKTATIARLLAAMLAERADLRIGLAAPTGKAAARMEEAVRQATAMMPASFSAQSAALAKLTATTLHRLLGWSPEGRTRFEHHASNPLPHDVVVVDEASMVNVVLMSRLLSALRPDARLVLVGDPDQLAPVEAGAVLADIVENPGSPPAGLSGILAGLGLPDSGAVVRLGTNHRSSPELARLAAAVLAGDADHAVELAWAGGMLFADAESAQLAQTITRSGAAIVAAARAGDPARALAALESHRLLCARRHGPYGVSWWGRQVQTWLSEAIPGLNTRQSWYPGLPLLITKNSPDTDLSNGDTGVVMDGPDGIRRAYFARAAEPHSVPVSLLDEAEPAYAMTVHKAQGSQFDAVSLILPEADSPLLTRELVYTAITRAKSKLRIIGTQESLRHGVLHRAQRASGLGRRL
jgi:exodeoxyribonuclease V alpha subunit